MTLLFSIYLNLLAEEAFESAMMIYVLIPLLPLAAAFVLAIFGEQLQGKGQRLVIPAVALSFGVSFLAFLDVSANGAIRVQVFQLLNVGQLKIDFGFYLDQLTVLLLLLVTGVSTVVQVYSSRYMVSDPRHSRFFALTALFTAAMTLLVMSSNLMVTFIF
ncbi:MAG: NADH-quinone oxidoreductase subunit L, partial [Candidatus Azotimanducaceae bacterium]